MAKDLKMLSEDDSMEGFCTCKPKRRILRPKPGNSLYTYQKGLILRYLAFLHAAVTYDPSSIVGPNIVAKTLDDIVEELPNEFHYRDYNKDVIIAFLVGILTWDHESKRDHIRFCDDPSKFDGNAKKKSNIEALLPVTRL